MMKLSLQALLCSLALTVPFSAVAQSAGGSYPSKPVTMVVPFAAGSATDVEARIYTTKLTETLGQPFLIDIKPGAGNRVATEFVMRSPPDGHTLMFTAATHAVIPISFPDLPYDLYKVLEPVSLLTKRFGLMVVRSSLPVKNLAEYIAYAKANPGKLNLVTAGAGGSQHLTGLWLNSVTGTEATMVHYKSANLGMLDMLAGRAEVHIGPRRSLLPHVKTGKFHAVAQTSLVRHPEMPDLPTIHETYPGFEYPSWLGVLAPAKTPLALRTQLAVELNKIVQLPETMKKLGNDVQPIGSTPQEFERLYLREHEVWKKIVKESNVKFD